MQADNDDHCCKRVSGACLHERARHQRTYESQIQQWTWALKNPELPVWDRRELEKKIAELPNPQQAEWCVNCKVPLRKDEVHAIHCDGAMGEYIRYTCAQII